MAGPIGESPIPGGIWNQATGGWMTPSDYTRYQQGAVGCAAQAQGCTTQQQPQMTSQQFLAANPNPTPTQIAEFDKSRGVISSTYAAGGAQYNLLDPVERRLAADPTAQVIFAGGQRLVASAGQVAEYAAGKTQGMFDLLAGAGISRFSAGAGGQVQPKTGGGLDITSVTIGPEGGPVRASAMRSATGGYEYNVGGAIGSTYQAAVQAAQSILPKSAPAPVATAQPSLAAVSEQAAQNRPGYYGLPGEGLSPQRTVGDTRTAGLSTLLQTAAMFGIAPAFSNKELATGTALEVSRQAAYAKGDIRSSQYYSGELQKLASRPVEQASEYHYLSKSTGVPTPANPWEYKADLAVELLKGAPQKAGEAFSPVSGEMSKVLPGGGYGLQQWSWDVALSTDRPDKYQQAPNVSFLPAIGYLAKATGEYGPYGSLYGGPRYAGTPSSEGIRKQPEFVFTPAAREGVQGALRLSAFERGESMTPIKTKESAFDIARAEALAAKPVEMAMGPDKKLYPVEFMGGQSGWKTVNTTGGRLVGSKTVAGVATVSPAGELPAPFLSVSKPAATPEKGDVFSQFGSWLSGAESYVGGVTGLSKLPSPTTEEIKKTAPYLAIVPGATPVGMALMTPGVSDYAASYVKGETTALREKPVATLASFGVGLGFGAVLKGAEVGVGAARAAAAPKIIAEGGMYRGAEQFAEGVVKYGPKALGAVFALDVGSKVTRGGTDFSPAAAERAGTIMATEVRPMMIGGMIGYETPTKAYTAAREAQIGYRQAQVEIAGERTTLLQKPTAPGEVGFKDVATYIYGPKVSAAKLQAADIISGRTGEVTVGRAIELGAKPTSRLAAAKQAALEAVMTAKVLAKPTIEVGLGKASIEVARYRYAKNQPILEAVYGKYFEAKTKLPAKAESAAISAYSDIWTLAQRAKHPVIEVKSAIQERGGIELPSLQRPVAEIARFNKMQEALRVPAKEPVTPVKAEPVRKTTLNVFKPTKEARTRFGVKTEKPIQKPSGTEVKTGKGISIAKVTETAREVARPMQGVELDIRGLPTYPSGPSPVQRQKYRVEEETQYLRLPPGMKSPGPKTLTVQEVVAIPSVMVGARQAQIQRTDPLSLLSQDILQKQETTQKERQEQVKVRESLYGVTTLPRTELKPAVTTSPLELTRTITATEPVVTTKPRTTVTTTLQKQTVIPVEPVVEIMRGRIPTTQVTTIPGRFALPAFGGGGAGGGARKGSRAYVEVLGFETSRVRKGAFTFGKRKAKK